MIRKSVAEILDQHVTFELEAIDRMYLNAYVPSLQTGGGFAYFLKTQFGVRVPSTVMIAPMSERFVTAIERFTETEGVDLVTFEKRQRKDDVAQQFLAAFEGDEGVLFVGKAQEKASVFRTEKRRTAQGTTCPWIYRSTAMPNHYYFYILDRDFGPLFIKFCSYFPYAAKLCLNGHEWLKRQLRQRDIPFEPLDNGIRSTTAARRVQQIADTLSADTIDAVFRKWLRRLPHPFAPAHRQAGYRYQLSILQAEFALTHVLDRPQTGRGFFEEVIRENLDIGRPDQVQLIFNRRVSRRTPGSFRTRVLTDGVVPSLHVQYKNSKIKQYHKEGQALRTETTINNTYDFEIGRALRNLPALREIGFAANRRLLRVEYLSHDSFLGDEALDALTHPVVVETQRAAALHLGDDTRVSECRLQGVFGEPRFSELYHCWRRHGDTVFEGISSPTIAEAMEAGRGTVECLVLTHAYRRLSPLVAETPSAPARVGEGLRREPHPQKMHPRGLNPRPQPPAEEPLSIREQCERDWHRLNEFYKAQNAQGVAP